MTVDDIVQRLGDAHEDVLRELLMAGYTDSALLTAFKRMRGHLSRLVEGVQADRRAVGGDPAEPVQATSALRTASGADRTAIEDAPTVHAARFVGPVVVTPPPENAKSIARKAIDHSGFCGSTIAVGSHLIERFNLKTGRCDPGIASIAAHIRVSRRTVQRAIGELVSAGLFAKARHGGRSHANAYMPNWPLLVERAAEGNVTVTKVSAEGDKLVTQNHLMKPDLESVFVGPQRRRVSKREPDRRQMHLVMPISGGRDKSEAAVRAKLNTQLNETLQPMGKVQFVEGLTRSMSINWSPAIEAEMCKAGSGLPILLDAIRDVGSSRKATG